MQSQSKACIVKSSRDVSTLLRYYTVLSGNSLLMFRDNQSIPSSRVKKLNRENTARSKLTDTIFFSWDLSIVCFLKKHSISEAGSLSQAKQHLNWWNPLIEPFLIIEYFRNSSFLKYARENRSSPRLVTRNWLLKK